MSKKPTYTFKDKNYKPIKIEKSKTESKRYILEVTMNKAGTDNVLVILKNPSRAGENNIYESDKTVSNVCEYFEKNRKQINTNKIIIMNLFPFYLTNSDELYSHKESLIDEENKKHLVSNIENADKIILAWGSHPTRCKVKFDEMKKFVSDYLIKKKNVYVMQRNGVNHKNPLHGQVWGYKENTKFELVNITDFNQYFNLQIEFHP